MSLPNRRVWSVATPHAPDCWCQFCFFHRLERVEAETGHAFRRARPKRLLPLSGSSGIIEEDVRE